MLNMMKRWRTGHEGEKVCSEKNECYMFIGTNFKYKNLQRCNLVYIHGYNGLKALNS